MQGNTYNIVKRVHGEHSVFCTVQGSWLEAMEMSEACQRMYADGEYFVRKHGEPLVQPAACPVQACWDNL